MTLATNIFQISNSVRRIARTRYPSYLFGLLTKEDRSPAFIFHDVVEQEFITDLDFLEQNKYETLSTERWIKNRLENKTNKSVLLTFDDARKNFYEVTFPLLKKRNKKATLFVPSLKVGLKVNNPSASGEISSVSFEPPTYTVI